MDGYAFIIIGILCIFSRKYNSKITARWHKLIKFGEPEDNSYELMYLIMGSIFIFIGISMLAYEIFENWTAKGQTLEPQRDRPFMPGVIAWGQVLHRNIFPDNGGGRRIWFFCDVAVQLRRTWSPPMCNLDAACWKQYAGRGSGFWLNYLVCNQVEFFFWTPRLQLAMRAGKASIHGVIGYQQTI